MKKYTEQELIQNYDRFIAFVKKAFAKNKPRLDALLHMYSEPELGQELVMAPASSSIRFHAAYPGGYIDHVMNVCKYTYRMKDMFQKEGGNINFTDEEMFFAAIHHDLGKLGDSELPYYIPEDSDWHIKNRGMMYKVNPKLNWMQVSDRTFYLLNKYDVKYSENEFLGIKLANGLYDEDTKAYFVNYRDGGALKTELPYLLHWADHFSVRVEVGQKQKEI